MLQYVEINGKIKTVWLALQYINKNLIHFEHIKVIKLVNELIFMGIIFERSKKND